jgi:hypothetical protein
LCYHQAMKKRLVASCWLLVAGLLLSGCTRLSFLSRSQPVGALQVFSNPSAPVYLNGGEHGQTPIKVEVKPGEYTVEIKSNGKTWRGKVEVNSGVLTVVNRELSQSEEEQSGEVITLERGLGLTIISDPGQAQVLVNGEEKGTTPLVLPEIASGDQTVVLKSPGFIERMVKVRTREGYKTSLDIKLAKEVVSSPSSPSTIVPSSSPISEPSGSYIVVLTTGTTFGLHVRSGPGLGHPVIADIKPGEKYPILGEENGWVNIRLADGREGWVSAKYVQKKE